MPLDPESITRFHERVALFRAGKLHKLKDLAMLRSMVSTALARASGKSRRTTVETFWGDRMNVVIPERGSVQLSRYNFVEDELTSVFMEKIRAGMTVFDIGSHFGYFTLLAAKLVGDTGRVHAFEPTPSTFDVLRSNVGERHNVRLNNVALFDRSGEIGLQDFGVEYSQFNSVSTDRMQDDVRRRAQAASVKVRAMTLDEYVETAMARPDFIKIDAENAEPNILRGATTTLTQIRPMLTLEVGDVDQNAVDAHPIAVLARFGYRPFEFRDGALHEHSPREKYPYDNLLFIPD